MTWRQKTEYQTLEFLGALYFSSNLSEFAKPPGTKQKFIILWIGLTFSDSKLDV